MSEEKKQEESSGFKVTDKRHFTPEGDALEREEEPLEEEKDAGASHPPEDAGAGEEPAQTAGGPAEEPAGAGAGEAVPVDFSHLVMSLASTAFYSLGLPDPVTKKKAEVNLQAASQMIDLLAILTEKTKSNLTTQEEQILTGTLTELRAAYVQVSGFGK